MKDFERFHRWNRATRTAFDIVFVVALFGFAGWALFMGLSGFFRP